MPHKHIPAHGISSADRFEDETTGYGYTVRQDTGGWTVIPDTKAGICNIYADSAEEALAYFQKEHEDRPIWEVLAASQANEIRVGNIVEKINNPGLDSHRVIALGGEGEDAWLWLDFQQHEINAGELPSRLPAANYRKVDEAAPVALEPLDPEAEGSAWLVSWSIDAEAPTPLQAAAEVWARTFKRNKTSSGDACVFTVSDGSGRSVEIDLSDYGPDVFAVIDDI